MIPLFKVAMASDVADFILPVLHSGYIGEGSKSQELEKAVGNFIGNENVILVNSGTSAITIALKLAGVEHGDKVVSTPMTCLATSMSILSVGAVPVWADILPDGTMNPIDVWRKVDQSGAKAIVCMDWGGLPCRLSELSFIAGHFGISLIEDACQALGAEYNGKKIGNQSEMCCFSFQAIKQLTTVDGGLLAITTNSPFYTKSLLEEGKTRRWFGLDRSKGADMRCNQDPPFAGYKWQSNDVLASIGLANIRGLQDRLEVTRAHARAYNDAFGIKTDPARESSYWLYTIFVKDVDKFIQYMKENGVECSRVHDRNDTKTVFKDSRANLPGVDWFDKYHVCIPVGWWLEDCQVEMISDLIIKYKENNYERQSFQGAVE